FDDHHAPIAGVYSELHVGTAGIDADLAQARNRGVAHDLIFLVGERLRGRHRDRVPGVHAHRIEILDRAHDDAVVLAVAHHLHLELFPADHRLLDEDFAGRTRVEPALDDRDEFFAVIRDAAAGAPQRERWTDDRREADHRLDLQRLFHAVGEGRARTRKADLRHRGLEL